MPLTGPVPKGGTFFCPHCGAMYSVTHSRLPKRDSNIAKSWSASKRWTSGTTFLSTSSFIGLKIPDRLRSPDVSVSARARLTPKGRRCHTPDFLRLLPGGTSNLDVGHSLMPRSSEGRPSR